MQRGHDERGKLIAEETLDAVGDVQREVEIPTADSQRIDLVLRRRRGYPAVLPRYLELMDRLFSEHCLLEIFGQAVSLIWVYEAIRKQMSWRQHLQHQRGEGDLVYPWQMWLVSAGRPDAVFDEFAALHPRPGFPPGVYDFGKGHRLGLVVIGELPTGRETLLLRLLGSPAVMRQAIAEIRQIPHSDPERDQLERLLVTLRRTMEHATKVDVDEKEAFMTAARAEVEEWLKNLEEGGRRRGLKAGVKEGLKQGMKEGMQKGLKEGLRESVLALSEVLGLTVTAEQQDQLQRMSVEDLQALQQHLRTQRTWPC